MQDQKRNQVSLTFPPGTMHVWLDGLKDDVKNTSTRSNCDAVMYCLNLVLIHQLRDVTPSAGGMPGLGLVMDTVKLQKIAMPRKQCFTEIESVLVSPNLTIKFF